MQLIERYFHEFFGLLIPILLAGSMTGLTRLSDVVERSGPNKDFIYNESKYYFGEGGYPSGHIVYAVMIFGMLL